MIHSIYFHHYRINIFNSYLFLRGYLFDQSESLFFVVYVVDVDGVRVDELDGDHIVGVARPEVLDLVVETENEFSRWVLGVPDVKQVELVMNS